MSICVEIFVYCCVEIPHTFLRCTLQKIAEWRLVEEAREARRTNS